MKKMGRILSLTLLIMVLATSFCFAGSLQIVDTYPEDGYKNAAIENFGIKVYFNQDVISEGNKIANSRCFTLTDAEGNNVPIKVLYSEKEEGMAMVIVDTTGDDPYKVTESTDYKLTIDEKFVSATGEPLGESKEITVRTLNQTRASSINMVLMMVLFAGMFFFSKKSTQKQEEKKKEEKEEKFNPYKIAKETGKSVEEVIAAEEKKRAKKAAAAKKKAAAEAEAKKQMEEIEMMKALAAHEEKKSAYDPYVKSVKAPRPISAGGSTYITGRKAEAEKKAAEARAKGTTNPKHKGGKKK